MRIHPQLPGNLTFPQMAPRHFQPNRHLQRQPMVTLWHHHGAMAGIYLCGVCDCIGGDIDRTGEEEPEAETVG